MENSINEVYHLDIVVLTPLHIGCGSEKDLVKGLDYIQNDGRIYRLNQKKMLKYIDISSLSSAMLNKDENLLIKKLSPNLASVSDSVFVMPTTSDNDIKTFIKNGLNNKPILPGSSLKGAIRSILFAHLKNNRQTKEPEIFGKPDVGDEFMRFIKVSDAAFEKTELVNTKIFNLIEKGKDWEGGWKHGGRQSDPKFKSTGFNTIYEILKPGNYSKISLGIADKVFIKFEEVKNIPFGEKKSQIINQPIEFLFGIINQHTKAYIEKEIEFFEKYANSETDAIIATFKAVLAQIPDDDSWCVLKMSAGSGFHSITGDWQFPKHHDLGLWTESDSQKYKLSFNQKSQYVGKKEKFKSRKIAIGSPTDQFKFAPMGFVKIGRKSEQELELERLELAEKLEAERIENEARLLKEAEEEAALKQAIIEEKERQKQQEFLRQQEIERIRLEEIERIESERLQLEAMEKIRIEKLEQKIEDGLTLLSKSIHFDDTKRKVDSWMKNAKVDILPEAQHKFLFSALMRFYNEEKPKDKKKWQQPLPDGPIWKKIAGWVGNDVALDWYKGMIIK